MSDILAQETLSRIDAFYDGALKSKLAAIDDPRRHVRWLIIKALMAILPPIAILIAGDLLDSVLRFTSNVGMAAIAWLWLAAGLVFSLVRYLVPGVTAYANYRTRFKQDIVAEIFKVVCSYATHVRDEARAGPGLTGGKGVIWCLPSVFAKAFAADASDAAFASGRVLT